MFQFIKTFKHSDEKKRLLSNFVSLSLLQAANYILPLLTFPYLIRVLGMDNFGLLIFATATIGYFLIITDYGFNLSATREISMNRHDSLKISEIFNSVMIIKGILTAVAILLLGILVFSFEKFSHDWLIYFLTFGMVIGQALFPTWFFQGMEQMRYITYINVFSKSIFTIPVFIFVQTEGDLYLVPLFNSLGFVMSGIWALYVINKKFSIRFQWQSQKILLYHLKESKHIFMSNLAISLYTISSVFLLGLFTNNTIVGYYAVAEKIIQAFKGLISPISQAIYPLISRKIQLSKESGLAFIRKTSAFVFVFTGLISVLIFIFANILVSLVTGELSPESVTVLKILAFTPFMIGLSNIFGIQSMVNFGRKKAFSRILIIGSILNIMLSLLLIPNFAHIGAGIATLIVESFITITMFIYLQRNGLSIVVIKPILN